MSGLKQMIVVMGGVSLFRRYVDGEDPDVIMALRVGYAVTQLVILGLIFYIESLMRARYAENEGPAVTVPPKAAPFGMNEGAAAVPEVMTSAAYDRQKVAEWKKKVGMGVLIISVIHLYFGAVVPLFIQCVLGFLNAYDSPLVQIYLLGRTISRPFPDPSPFANLMPQADQPTPNNRQARRAEERKKEE